MNWVLATTLRERYAEFSPTSTQIDTQRGDIRMEMLRTAYNRSRFDELREAGRLYPQISDELFTKILGETLESLTKRSLQDTPEWAKLIGDVLREHHKLVQATPKRVNDSDATEKHEVTLPDVFMRPFASWFNKRIMDIITKRFTQDELYSVVTPHFINEIARLDIKQAFEIVSRSLILELNVDRVENRLKGESPEEEFQSFVESFRFDEQRLQNYFSEYIVFGRRFAEYLIDTTAARLDILNAVVHDMSALREVFAWQVDDLMDGITYGVGDTHNRGRSVCVLETKNAKKVVWKPRSLEVDVKLAEFLSFLSDLGLEKLKTPITMNRDRYGWQEYVTNKPCPHVEDFHRYYRRLGRWLCIAYVFGTTDLHYENIVAVGDHPIPIDLETLFHPRLKESQWNTSVSEEGNLEFSNSVLATGLLPSPFLPPEFGEEGVDLSGLSPVDGVQTPFAVPVVENIGRSDMHVSAKRVPLHPAGNIPRSGDIRAEFRTFLDDVCEGFQSTYVHLMEHRRELLGSAIVNMGFRNLIVRVVPRATALYAQVLSCLAHPDYGRDGLDIERLLSYFRMYPLADATALMAQSEIEQLSRGDIPMFVMRSDGNAVTDVGGDNVCIEDVGCPLSEFKNKLTNLSRHDLSQQLYYIQSSFYASDLVGHDMLSTTAGPVDNRILKIEKFVSNPQQFVHEDVCDTGAIGTKAIDIATKIGDHLISRSFNEGCRGWMGLKLVSEKYWRMESVGLDMYSGLPGIGYFLHMLARATGLSRFSRAARSVANAVVEHWIAIRRDFHPEMFSPLDNGMYGAIGGGMYFLSEMIASEPDPYYVMGLDSLIFASKNSIEQCGSADIIGGHAGLLQSLRAVRSVVDDQLLEEVRGLAIRAFSLIAEGMVKEEGGIGWHSSSDGRSLLGYSHGAAGIAAGLACGYSAFEDEAKQVLDIHTVVDGAFSFEEFCYDRFGLWPDFRTGMTSNAGPGTWCHGAAGIALARSVVDNAIGSSYSESKYYDACVSKLRYEFSRGLMPYWNLSLCHGALGNLEALRSGGRAEDKDLVGTIERQVLNHITARGLPCGVPGGLEVPGLMSGLAGIGLGLLRFNGHTAGTPLLATFPDDDRSNLI